MKKEITKNEELQLIGLITLAKKHYKIVSDCEKEMEKIVGGDDEYGGLLSDNVYSRDDNDDVSSALKDMGIKVR